ncbi:hypothetical protein [Martelella limonii]|uniref:hypothetical protein n=1 Tax=Martelella limonii TaxID=1647649 RepID=UPI001580E243|nr:hypothetical protein [Martelella limonii]
MLEDDVAAFLSGNVMIVAAITDAALRPHIGRGCGAYFDGDQGDIVLLASSTQWPDFYANAAKGGMIAATFANPSSYRAIQVKGAIGAVARASPEQVERAARYVAVMLDILAGLGVSRLQLSSVFCDADLIAIRFWPADLFVQTPGPGAGARLRSDIC